MEKRLYKSRTDVKIDGVCAGLAHYFGVDATLVRIIWIVLSIAGGGGIIIYVCCALLMQREPFIDDRDEPYKDYTNYSSGNEN